MSCKPKTVTKRPIVKRPPVPCGNCGCRLLQEGECHCGAIVHWAWDSFDGWYVVTSGPPLQVITVIIDPSLPEDHH